jgi:hypothetical protein
VAGSREPYLMWRGGGGTNQRRADNKETHSNWIIGGSGYFKTGLEWSVLFGLSGPSPPPERPFFVSFSLSA